MSNEREKIKDTRRWVVKIGSALLTDNGCGLKHDLLDNWVSQIAELNKRGIEIVIVSSGAVAEGVSRLGWKKRPNVVHELQAAAAVGQMGLIQAYEVFFQKYNKHTAQILLTHDDVANRARYLNARTSLNTLLKFGVIPVVNENDSVATDEIRFGDNDNLSALVTNLVEADMLIILSDVNGLYDQNPVDNPQAELIPVVERVTPEIEALGGESSGTLGTGGMSTKLKAAKRAALSGVGTLIVNGRRANILSRVFAGEELGTYFLPAQSKLTAKKHWIAFSKKPKGKLIIDEGGQTAVIKRGKSLLPAGICGVDGGFERGDAVRLCNQDGKEFARGVISYSLAEVLQIMGKQCVEIEKILGYKYRDEVVCRDNLVLATTNEEEIY